MNERVRARVAERVVWAPRSWQRKGGGWLVASSRVLQEDIGTSSEFLLRSKKRKCRHVFF
jgi:hypothetical protein